MESCNANFAVETQSINAPGDISDDETVIISDDFEGDEGATSGVGEDVVDNNGSPTDGGGTIAGLAHGRDLFATVLSRTRYYDT